MRKEQPGIEYRRQRPIRVKRRDYPSSKAETAGVGHAGWTCRERARKRRERRSFGISIGRGPSEAMTGGARCNRSSRRNVGGRGLQDVHGLLHDQHGFDHCHPLCSSQGTTEPSVSAKAEVSSKTEWATTTPERRETRKLSNKK